VPRNSKLGDTVVLRAGEDTVDLSSDERRGSARYGFTATAEVVDMRSRTRMNTRISDLSMEGCYVDTNAPFPIRTKVRIRVSASKKTFETQGVVVYSLPNMGMGIAFDQPEPPQAAILKSWIDELSGAVPVAFEPIDSDAPASTEFAHKDAQLHVLQELITALMRKNTLTETEGKALLQHLSK
jgi:PilZ domain